MSDKHHLPPASAGEAAFRAFYHTEKEGGKYWRDLSRKDRIRWLEAAVAAISWHDRKEDEVGGVR